MFKWSNSSFNRKFVKIKGYRGKYRYTEKLNLVSTAQYEAKILTFFQKNSKCQFLGMKFRRKNSFQTFKKNPADHI